MWVFNDGGSVGTVTLRHTAVIGRRGTRAAEGLGTAAPEEKVQNKNLNHMYSNNKNCSCAVGRHHHAHRWMWKTFLCFPISVIKIKGFVFHCKHV